MSRLLAQLLVPLALASLSAPVWAHDDDHHGRRHHRKEYKEEYWDGQCKIERKWKKNGEYKEKRKCRDRPVVYQAAPVYTTPALVISPQIVIRP